MSDNKSATAASAYSICSDGGLDAVPGLSFTAREKSPSLDGLITCESLAFNRVAKIDDRGQNFLLEQGMPNGENREKLTIQSLFQTTSLAC